MLRRNIRLRKEYLYRKQQQTQNEIIASRKQMLAEALASGRPIPTELQQEAQTLYSALPLEDRPGNVENDGQGPNVDPTIVSRNVTKSLDDEYAYAGLTDPKVLITTARDPSSRLLKFAKELKLVIPQSQRINRGAYVIKDLVNLCRSHEVTDLLVLHEHRGEPTGLIVSHLPHGPTAYFSIEDVILRHDLSEKPPTMSEVFPHLIFHNLTTALGRRLTNILKYLFPPANPTGQRVHAFIQKQDKITFRQYTWSLHPESETELIEVGPRFTLKPYCIELGTLEMKEVPVEWTYHSFLNKPKSQLSKPV